jgi:thymidylate synthase ThyX
MISAKIVADSICPKGHRLTTLEVVMPRYILAEFNTHRMLSKNSASSRAIPFNKMVKNIQENPFIPYAWQKDHKGMQGTEYLTEHEDIKSAEEEWLKARNLAIQQAYHLNQNIGITKQLANRLLEPFMYHKVLVSGTEWENFFNLRCPSYEWEYEEGTIKAKSKEEFLNMFLKRYPTNGEKDLIDELGLVDEDLKPINLISWLNINKGQADIHMMFLAEAIYDAINESTPKELKEREWHIPYGEYMDENKILDKSAYGYEVSNQENQGGWTIEGGEEAYYYILNALKCKISIARCARLSYQTLGDNPVIDYEKDLALYESLSTSGHYSPFEHVARVMTNKEYVNNHIHRDLKQGEPVYAEKQLGWCRNFRGFIMYRSLLD